MKTNTLLRKSFSVIIALLFMSISIYSQEKTNGEEDYLDFDLESLLNVKVVSASRHEQNVTDSPRAISIITAKEIREQNYRNTPEALNQLVGVHLQQTNYGGGSVVMRGLIGNQILILVDGIRMNNAIYRLGPNQYLNTIDINSIERIEVVRGTGAVLYGSDALGGLVNIITKSGIAKDGDSENIVRGFGRYSSADNGMTGRVEIGKEFENLSLFGGVSVKKFGDLTAGSETGLQEFTGYDEWDADLKLKYSPAEDHSIVLAYQRVTQNDVPRSDVLLRGADVERYWDPQLRELLYLDYNFQNVSSFIDNANVRLYTLKQSEDAYRITTSSTNTQRHYTDKVNSLGATLQLSSSINDSHLFTYGADLTFDKVSSSREDKDLTTGSITQKSGTFADQSENNTIAFFVQDEINISEKLVANLGLRYSIFQVKAKLENDAIGSVDVDINPSAFVGSAHLMYEFTEGFKGIVGVSQGFRAPNIDDATQLGSSGSRFEVPNPNLDPEESINYELGFKIFNKKFSSSIFAYYNDSKGIIQRESYTYNGLSYIDANENGVKDENEEGVYTRKNVGEANIYGLEAEARYLILKNLAVSGNIAWTKGTDDLTEDPLRRIPPIEGMLACKWNVNNKSWVEAYSMFAGKQDRLAPGDIDDKRIPDGGTPGYVTLNVRGGYNLNNYGNVSLSVENITNTTYRLHASGFDMPGTNFVFGYEITL